ncbi:MAG: hypothetical protein NPIRA02_04860 [Nitrospirales bacterium]|nr:MAG: hypothetical protein NPIRA02_04860 [Nitrospirales bacterium]
MRICVVGDPEDLSAAYLIWLAKRRGAEVIVLSENDLGLNWRFQVPRHPEKSTITMHDRVFSVHDIHGAFVRLNPKPVVHDRLGVPPEAEHIYVMERRYGLHWLLNEVPFPVINRPCAGRSNSSKPYQMMLLERHEFAVPRWRVTNDPKVMADFLAECQNGAIYKASSGLRSRVRRVDETLFTLMAEGTSPAVVQQYIPGFDVRIHVIGRTTFATQIRSHGIDYRFESEGVEYSRIEVPPLIQSLCIKTAASEGLILAGFDFRKTVQDEWWCLEMNPVPTFLPYEASTGHPIGDTILDYFGDMPSPGQCVSPLVDLVEQPS